MSKVTDEFYRWVQNDGIVRRWEIVTLEELAAAGPRRDNLSPYLEDVLAEAQAALQAAPAGGEDPQEEYAHTLTTFIKGLQSNLKYVTETIKEGFRGGDGAALDRSLAEELPYLLRIAIELGEAVQRLRVCQRYSKDVERSQRVMDAARRGHEATHGSRESKEGRWAVYQATVDAIRAGDQRLSHDRACQLAADRLTKAGTKVSHATVKRHTVNRRQK